MKKLSERVALASVTVLANGDLRIERCTEVLRGGQAIHSTPEVQVISLGDDISQLELEPLVLNVAAAAWTPEQVQAAAAKKRDVLRASLREEAAALAREQADLARSIAVHRRAVAAHAKQVAHLDAQESALHERRKTLHQATHAQNVAEQRNA